MNHLFYSIKMGQNLSTGSSANTELSSSFTDKENKYNLINIITLVAAHDAKTKQYEYMQNVLDVKELTIEKAVHQLISKYNLCGYIKEKYIDTNKIAVTSSNSLKTDLFKIVEYTLSVDCMRSILYYEIKKT